MRLSMYRLAIWSALLAPALLSGCADKDTAGSGSGMIESEEVIVSAEIAGRVMTRLFDEGSVVRTGDTLAVIDTTRVALQRDAALTGRNAAEAQLSTAHVQLVQARETEQFAKGELDRVSRLLSSGTASQRQFDQGQHEYNSAVNARRALEAQIRTIEAELARIDVQVADIERAYRDCFPLAPTRGTITEKYIAAGELLAPGKPIARIASLDTVWVKVYLPTSTFAHVKIGQRAAVSTESGGQRFDGTVVWTSDEAEFTPKNVQTEEARANLLYAVKVLIPNPEGVLKIGMPVFVTMELQ